MPDAGQDRPIFVPVALSWVEAIALEAAAGAMFASAPINLGADHPLMTGAVKIRDARHKAEAVDV
jgi:hypothetical protein